MLDEGSAVAEKSRLPVWWGVCVWRCVCVRALVHGWLFVRVVGFVWVCCLCASALSLSLHTSPFVLGIGRFLSSFGDWRRWAVLAVKGESGEEAGTGERV